nr:ROK family protein [Desulfuribacillus alkaliarsenatis]
MGVDIGGSTIKNGLFLSSGQLVYESKLPTPRNGNYQELLDSLANGVKELIMGANVLWSQVSAIGVGVPAFINFREGIILHAPNLSLRNINLQKDLEKIWNKPVFIENDANLAALGETWLGAGNDSKHLMLVTIGTGIGCGIIIDNKIYHGSIGLAGEIGHMTIVHENGRECTCGKTGCLETEVSAKAISIAAGKLATRLKQGVLVDYYKKQGSISSSFVIEQAKLGDIDCLNIIADMGKILGSTLANVATILNPEKILIGGGIASVGNHLIVNIQKGFKQQATPLIYQNTTIELAKLVNRAGITGAAKLALSNTK